MAVTINNVAYSWAMIQLKSTGLGQTTASNSGTSVLGGVTAIQWSKKRNVATNYGLGGNPTTRGFGNYTYTASITMDYNTYVTLLGAHTSLMEIGQFDLIISFANAVDGSSFTTHTVTLSKCIFDEDAMEASQDDTNITHEFQLNPFEIIIAPEAAS